MADEIFSRARMVLGDEAMERLSRSTVAVFGIGGVGSYVAEALARGGVGHLILCDNDVVSLSNINRQLIALHSTVGQPKVDVMARRIRDINPAAKVETCPLFYGAETCGVFDMTGWDYIADAIDSVSSKLLLIEQAKKNGVPILCSMGTGNKLDPSRLQITDISRTSVCPMARVMRRELKKRGISGVQVLFSTEEPISPQCPAQDAAGCARRGTPGSVSFVPSVAGLMIAGEIIRKLIPLHKPGDVEN